MTNRKNIVVLSGAGISAESGLKTFRDAGGLWEGHDVMKVASPEGWRQDRELVLEFYNQRRRQLFEVEPNAAHHALVELEQHHDVQIITQNVDDLHERAGSSKVLHLHGELRKARSTHHPHLVYDWDDDITIKDTCEKGTPLRPHIVWFGEDVPMLETAALITSEADTVIIVGTSLQVYPAASLVGFSPAYAPIYYVDPKPANSFELVRRREVHVIAEVASAGIHQVVQKLIDSV